MVKPRRFKGIVKIFECIVLQSGLQSPVCSAISISSKVDRLNFTW